MTIVLQWLPLTVLLIELVIKIVALGTIPRNRRPSSSLAWLLLISRSPVFGLILFCLIGSPFVRGRREQVQTEADQVILEHTADMPPDRLRTASRVRQCGPAEPTTQFVAECDRHQPRSQR